MSRRHGSRAHWPPDAVVYPTGSDAFISRNGDGDFGYLYADGDGTFLDAGSGGGGELPENLVTFNGDPVTFNGDYVVYSG